MHCVFCPDDDRSTMIETVGSLTINLSMKPLHATCNRWLDNKNLILESLYSNLSMLPQRERELYLELHGIFLMAINHIEGAGK